MKANIEFTELLQNLNEIPVVKGYEVQRRKTERFTIKEEKNQYIMKFPVVDRNFRNATLIVTLKKDDNIGIDEYIEQIWHFIYNNVIYTAEFVNTIVQSEAIEDIVGLLLKGMLYFSKMDEASLIIIDEEQKKIEKAFRMDKNSKKLEEYKSSARLHEGISGVIIEERKLIYIKDSFQLVNPNPEVLNKKRRTIIGIPLIANGKIIALLYLNSKSKIDFTNVEIKFFERFIKTAVHPIYRIIVTNYYKETISKINLLNNISRLVANKEKFDNKAIEEILLMLKTQLVLHHLAILLKKGDKLFIKAQCGYKGNFLPVEGISIYQKGITPYVYLSGEVYYAQDVIRDEKYIFGGKDIKSEIAIPLKIGRQTVGVFDVTSDEFNAFSEKDIEILKSVADIISLALQRSLNYEEKERFSLIDPLTGLYNRRYMEAIVPKLIEGEKREGGRLTVCMLDIDGFKGYNDTYGHQKGDDILKLLGKIILDDIRKMDIPIRYGGDEIFVVFPHTKAEVSVQIIDRIRKSFFVASNNTLFFSAGVASFSDNVETLSQLIKKADSNLYRAKNQGKGITIV